MIFYTTTHNNDSVAILHFGIGLLGKALFDTITGSIFFNNINIDRKDFDWNAITDYESVISDFFTSNLLRFPKGIKNVHILWSAGKEGFSASESRIEREYQQFKLIVNILSKLLSENTLQGIFYLLSSAGGLHEGQSNITSKSDIKLLRPYSHLKLKQENYIQEMFSSHYIFRISSAYSIDTFNKRKGLIQVLIENGLQNKVSSIYGEESTLRDYVLDKDIAKFIVGGIAKKNTFKLINYLVNGKPSSIFEIKKYIEFVLSKKIFITYPNILHNSKNISFSPVIKPTDFSSSNLQINIKLMYYNLLKKEIGLI